jgi:hypothetical protein
VQQDHARPGCLHYNRDREPDRRRVPSHSPVHSPAAPDPKLATNTPPGFSHAAMFAINGP